MKERSCVKTCLYSILIPLKQPWVLLLKRSEIGQEQFEAPILRYPVCANGALANEIIANHNLEFGQGDGSPFQALCEKRAKVLLIGVGFNRVTLLHYAESKVANGRRKTRRFPAMRKGKRVWVEVPDVGDDLDTHFPIIGSEFEQAGHVESKRIGSADCRLMNACELVEHAVRYFEQHPEFS